MDPTKKVELLEKARARDLKSLDKMRGAVLFVVLSFFALLAVELLEPPARLREWQLPGSDMATGPDDWQVGFTEDLSTSRELRGPDDYMLVTKPGANGGGGSLYSDCEGASGLLVVISVKADVENARASLSVVTENTDSSTTDNLMSEQAYVKLNSDEWRVLSVSIDKNPGCEWAEVSVNLYAREGAVYMDDLQVFLVE